MANYGTIPVVTAGTPQIFNVSMANADHEYSQALPNGCKGFSMSVQDGLSTENFRFAYESGKVAGPTAPFKKYNCDVEVYQINLNAADVVLYFACSEAGKVMQIESWL